MNGPMTPVRRLLAKYSQFANPYHGEDGKFAPKGRVGNPTDSLEAGYRMDLRAGIGAEAGAASVALEKDAGLGDHAAAVSEAAADFDSSLTVGRADEVHASAKNLKSKLDEAMDGLDFEDDGDLLDQLDNVTAQLNSLTDGIERDYGVAG